jgi:hypothetical protein
MDTINTRTKLSALWLFILLNIIFRDIHQMTLKSHLEMLLTGYYNGVKITEAIMLMGAFVVQIPISMFLCSLLLTRKTNRVANMISGLLMPVIILSSPPTDMDDFFHLAVELLAITVIVWTAWKWKEEKAVPLSKEFIK